MSDDWDDELTLELARELVARADPEELPVLEAVGPALLADGTDPQPRSDGSLGFGIELIAIASVAVPVASSSARSSWPS